MESKPRTLRITRIREQGRDIRSFDLMPDDADAAHDVQFIPGQVGVLRVADEEPAYFAFAGAPEDPELEILVKRTIGASMALFDMKEGEHVELINVTGHGFDRLLSENKSAKRMEFATGLAAATLLLLLLAMLLGSSVFPDAIIGAGHRYCRRILCSGRARRTLASALAE